VFINVIERELEKMSTKKIVLLVSAILLSCVCLVIAAAAGLMIYSVQQVNNLPSIYDEQADAKQDVALALKQAKTEGKYVLLDFGADWCPDCHALDSYFEDSQIKPFLDQNYVVVKINVGNWDTNLDISEKYGDPIARGIPAIVILDADEQIITATENGEMATASTSSAQEVLAFLQTYAP
jgi:thioredoxin 1